MLIIVYLFVLRFVVILAVDGIYGLRVSLLGCDVAC